MKKAISICLCLCMLLSWASLSAVAQEESPTTPTAIPISTAQEFHDEITKNKEGLFYLTADIVLTKDTLIPQGDIDTDAFKGALDGKGHSITYEDQEHPVITISKGGFLFPGLGQSNVRAGTVKNLTLGTPDKPLKIVFEGANCGVIGGQITHRSNVDHVTVYADISATTATGNRNIGGLFGKSLQQPTITNCCVFGSAELSSGTIKFGGILGGDLGGAASADVSVENCINFTTVTINGDANDVYVGGILGFANSKGKLTVTNCINLAGAPEIMEGKKASVGDVIGVKGSNASQVSEENNVAATVTTTSGAAIRFLTPTGLRFRSVVTGYEALKEIYGAEHVKLGTLIAPAQYVESAGAFTKEALNAYRAANGIEVAYEDVPYTSTAWFEAQEGNFTGALAAIQEVNYSVKFAGIGYISVCINSVWYTVYAEYSADNARTVSEVADAALKDLRDEASEGYPNLVEGSGQYSPYTAEQLEQLKQCVPQSNG